MTDASMAVPRKNTLIRAILFLLFWQFSDPRALFAETLILNNGQEINGKITKRTPDFIRIEENGIPMTYFYKEIRRIIDSSRDPASKVSKPAVADPDYTEISHAIRDFFGQANKQNNNNAIDHFAPGSVNFNIHSLTSRGDTCVVIVSFERDRAIKSVVMKKTGAGWKVSGISDISTGNISAQRKE
jgi:hypothetical protein